MKKIGFLGLGAYVPERIMTNEEWSQYVETSDEWITTRTGIKERRIAAPEQSTLDLAEKAARAALLDANLTPQEIDELIVATDTPEVYAPDTASYLQHRLGARNIPSYDLAGSGCAGFLQALDVARSRVSDERKNILVVGVELLTRLMNWKDRNTCVLFGDAAGSAVMSSGDEVSEILASAAGTDGSQSEILCLEVGGTRKPFTLERAQRGEHQNLVMKGREVYKEAVHRMAQVSQQVLAKAGVNLDDVALVIPHQANLRILEAVGEALNLPSKKLFINVHKFGNTGSASVPVALCQAREQGRIKKGDLVLLTSFGAGLHWASLLVKF
ncbi:ketoacyl-ACP synthase III [Candidatus Acetothermia bacterium]|nr:ketoacyl-ACP synthase III [Candidatus Acetothermia bacterium]MBI3643666.1 ketoacyl-ACP synthase III [Candidatus Acetothermia bacterium]